METEVHVALEREAEGDRALAFEFAALADVGQLLEALGEKRIVFCHNGHHIF